MSTQDISGLWLYRSFNPTYVAGDQTDQRELELILADGFVFNFQTPTSTTLEGTFGFPDGGFPLDLKGTVREGEPARFDIVGTGRTGTETNGWEYHYQGHLTRHWPEGVDQRPALVGSVIRVKSHNGESRRAGSVYSFIAVKQPQPAAPGLSGLWAYRSFENNPAYVLRGATYGGFAQKPQPAAHELILQEAVFNLQARTGTTLDGTIEWLGGTGLDLKGTAQPGVGGEPSSFEIVGTGRTGSETTGWEYRYQGHLTPQWPNGGNQRPALVGSIIRSKSHGVAMRPWETSSPRVSAPAGYVAPFIAVKQ